MVNHYSRPDRDKYIRIIEKNAIPEKLENFRKMSSADIDSLGQPYDYYSVMHYRKVGNFICVITIRN